MKYKIIFLFLISLCFLMTACENPYYEQMLKSTLDKIKDDGSDGGDPDPTHFTVTFNANGGTGTVPVPIMVEIGDPVTIPANDGLIRTGYTFSHWNTLAAGTGTQYAADDSFTPDSSMTLFARWTPVVYFVTYNSNAAGVTGTTANSTHIYDAQSNLTLNGFTRSDYVFAGWNTAADGSGTSFTNGQQVVNLSAIESDMVTLFAVWEPVSGTLSLTLTVGQILNGDPVIPPTPITVSRGAVPVQTAFTVNVPNPGDYTFFRWEIAGVGFYIDTPYVEQGASVSSFIINGTNHIYNTLGGHSLMLTVTYQGVNFMVNIPFTIVN
jgi:uncharacterized repeat protein (TIGR02543 family)